MRVISGTAKGRKLFPPDGFDIRPTTDNVKESLFNILQFDIEGRKVLDLFSGSGQLGIECLSRGAEYVAFVDASREAVKIIRENLKKCGFTADVYLTDAISFLQKGEKFDIVFVDPPYDSDYYEIVMKSINMFDILNKGGIIVFESRSDREIGELREPYYMLKSYVYGTVRLSLVSRK